MGRDGIAVVLAPRRRDQVSHALPAYPVVGRGLDHQREVAVQVEALSQLAFLEDVGDKPVYDQRSQRLTRGGEGTLVTREELAGDAAALHVGTPTRGHAPLVHVYQARAGEEDVGTQPVVHAEVPVVAQDHDHGVVVGAGLLHGADAAAEKRVVHPDGLEGLGRKDARLMACVVELCLVRKEHVGPLVHDEVLHAGDVELVEPGGRVIPQHPLVRLVERVPSPRAGPSVDLVERGGQTLSRADHLGIGLPDLGHTAVYGLRARRHGPAHRRRGETRALGPVEHRGHAHGGVAPVPVAVTRGRIEHLIVRHAMAIRPAAAHDRGVAHVGERGVDALDVLEDGRAPEHLRERREMTQLGEVVGEQRVHTHDKEPVHCRSYRPRGAATWQPEGPSGEDAGGGEGRAAPGRDGEGPRGRPYSERMGSACCLASSRRGLMSSGLPPMIWSMASV